MPCGYHLLGALKLQEILRCYYIKRTFGMLQESLLEEALNHPSPSTQADSARVLNGTIKFPDGSAYDGGLLRGSIRHGFGRQLWPDNSSYEGWWQYNKANGKGTFIYSNGDVYEGDWKDDKSNGKGVYKKKGGSTYTGDWVDDNHHGYGVEVWPDGTKYEGHYQNGKKHGKGKYTWVDGSTYEGDWVNNLMEGFVIFFRLIDGGKIDRECIKLKMDGYI